MLVAGETAGEAERSRQIAGQRSGIESCSVGIGLHIPPWIEMQIADNLFVGICDVDVAAQTVWVDVVHAVHTVAAHADRGETVYLSVPARIILIRGHPS